MIYGTRPSREPLGIDGEQVFRVPPLSVPSEGDNAAVVRASEAVRLLDDRAAAQRAALALDGPGAEVAGRICRRLDSLPLAVELAAARLRVMTADELDARLYQRFAILTGGPQAGLARQQTLRSMADWSWELLTPAEQSVLAALSVFAGGFGLAAAEAVVAGPGVPAAEVLGHLAAWWTRAWSSSAAPGPGRAGTGCWKRSASTGSRRCRAPGRLRRRLAFSRGQATSRSPRSTARKGCRLPVRPAMT
jgi:predicted ATPase